MGEFLAVLTALFYAAGVILLKRAVGVVPPFALNLVKNCVALMLIVGTTVVLGEAGSRSVPPRDLAILFASGAIGIGVSDTLFLMALKRLGASRTALVDCVYSPFVILFSFLMAGETLPAAAAIGGVLILGSVALTAQRDFGAALTRRQFWIGCGLGLAAMATVAFAVVLVKPLLNSYPLSWLAAARMASGVAVLLLVLPFHPDRGSVYALGRPQAVWKWIAGGAFFASYLSLLTWLAGFKYSEAGVVALLNQTSTVLIVIFAWLFLDESMTRLKLLAVAMALTGAALVAL